VVGHGAEDVRTPKKRIWPAVGVVVLVIVVTSVGARVQAALGYDEPSSYIPVGVACGLIIGLTCRWVERRRRRGQSRERA
jgi:peptidoglycan/LPS O-acetylase OafA/YrhL